MGNKIYVGNLPFSATNESLSEMFSKFGAVDSSKIITDRDTGRSKGFGFVEMSSNDEADAAIEKLNGADMGGRALTVNEARPMEPRTGGGGFGGGRGGDRGGDRGGRGGDRGGFGGGNRW
jgi:RNA recognition motif-containing protein